MFFSKKKKIPLPLPPEPDKVRFESELPEIPSLPEFPEIPKQETTNAEQSLPELPQLPEIKRLELPSQRRIEIRERPRIEIPQYEETEYSIPKPLFSQPTRAESAPHAPVFVSSSDYQEITENTEEAKQVLIQAEYTITELAEIRNKEQKEFEKWRTELEQAEKRLAYIDSLISKAEVITQ